MTDYHKKTKTELICELNNALDALAICSHGPAVIRMQKQNAELQKQLVDKVEYCHTAEANFDLTTNVLGDLRFKTAQIESENAELKIEALYCKKEITRLEGNVTGLAAALEIALEAMK